MDGFRGGERQRRREARHHNPLHDYPSSGKQILFVTISFQIAWSRALGRLRKVRRGAEMQHRLRNQLANLRDGASSVSSNEATKDQATRQTRASAAGSPPDEENASR